MEIQIAQSKEELKNIDKTIDDLSIQLQKHEIDSIEHKQEMASLINVIESSIVIDIPFVSALKVEEKPFADMQNLNLTIKNYEDTLRNAVTTQLNNQISNAKEESNNLRSKIAEDENKLEKIIEEKVPKFENVKLEYSAKYNISSHPLNAYNGIVYFNGHKETYYSQKVLPGGALNIPGRHVADDGTIRDKDGYICVAADFSYLSEGSTVMTSLGPAKVYDTGCAYGIIDIYVNW